MHFLAPLLLLPLSASALLSPSIPLTKIKTLTLRADKQTTSRRLPAIPQLKCIGGNAAGLYTVDTMRCTNVGSDYDGADVQWTCTANMPADFKLGSTDVLCEGYDSPEDPRVLKGSCGVEYRLILTERGEDRYGRSSGGLADKIITALVLLFIAGTFCFIIYQCIAGRRRGGQPLGGRGWGGGGPDDGNDPPPPYSTFPSKGNSGPGFWTGAAAGAAGGYAAGRWNRQSYEDRAPRSSRGSSSSAGSSRSSPTYSSTGFGGTTRR